MRRNFTRDAGFQPKSAFHQNFLSNESGFRQALTATTNQDRGLGKLDSLEKINDTRTATVRN